MGSIDDDIFNIRSAPPEVLIPHIYSVVNDGGVFPLVVTGVSMKPFIRPKTDTVYIEKSRQDIRKGDVLFCRRGTDGVLHRVSKVCDNCFYMMGDAHIKPDSPYRYDDIIGTAVYYSRGKKKKRTNTPFIRVGVALYKILIKISHILKISKRA